MSNGTGDWFKRKEKREAILRVMKHIAGNPADGQKCVGNDAEARKLFEDPKVGNIAIPADARVIVFKAGELDLREGSSVIIELPPAPATMPTHSPNPSDRELLSYVIGNYVHW
jgi:hypothetical protein